MRTIGTCLNRIACLLCCLCLLALLPSCTAPDKAALSRFEQTHVGLFDTAYTFVAYTSDQDAFDRIDAALFEELSHYHKLFDIYNTYDDMPNLCTLNASGGPVTLDPDVIELLTFGRDVYDQTHGAVNIACGALSTLWKTYRDAANRTENPVAALPAVTEIQAALAKTDITALALTDQTAQITRPGMTLDVGAIAKGYAARKAMEYLRENGVTAAMLNLGGTVCTIGAKPGSSELWSVGVTNPDDPGAYGLVLQVSDRSVATSGDYERYFEVDGTRYCHILDTATGYPARTVRAVTVIAEDAALADALSTALFVLPVSEGQALIEETQGAEALWITANGENLYSSGCKTYVRNAS